MAADTSFEFDRLPTYRDIEHGRAHCPTGWALVLELLLLQT